MTSLTLSPDVPYLEITCPHCGMPVFARVGRAADAVDFTEHAIAVGATAITLHAKYGCRARHRRARRSP